MLDVLGHESLSETTLPGGGGHVDRLLFDSPDDRREAVRRRDGETEAMFGRAGAVLEAKRWDAAFDERFSERRSYRDASYQIKHYLERTPERLAWGILTNGRKWRLYGTKEYRTETYYEVDLPELLESGDLEAFNYFFAFFRPAAFRRDAGAADLIEAFVPYAVSEAGGVAGFRETATKTNSLVDRLRALTLPALDDVTDGLANYVAARERAAELDERIARTDDLIDEVVYDLYGLTDEERAVVEDAV